MNFFELHAKFEEIYTDLVEKVDEIAERILTLGYTPNNAYSQYLKVSRIQEDIAVSTAQECLTGTLKGLTVLLEQQREILNFAGEAEDEGTASQMSDYIKFGCSKLLAKLATLNRNQSRPVRDFC